MSEIGTDQTYVHHILSEMNGEHELSKHNGLEPLKLVFMRKRERERVVHNVLELLLRIFELKIKFAFYDLPCSFPIKRIFRRFRFIYFFFLAEAPVSLYLSLSIAHHMHSIICSLSRTIFFNAHECSNS